MYWNVFYQEFRTALTRTAIFSTKTSLMQLVMRGVVFPRQNFCGFHTRIQNVLTSYILRCVIRSSSCHWFSLTLIFKTEKYKMQIKTDALSAKDSFPWRNSRSCERRIESILSNKSPRLVMKTEPVIIAWFNSHNWDVYGSDEVNCPSLISNQ